MCTQLTHWARLARSSVEYWQSASKPLTSLLFVAPMLLAYEAGLWWLGPQAMRNGADVWLRRLLEGCGFSQYFLLPLLTCGILLGWHHVQRDPWKIGYGALYGMLFESVTFGTVLLLAAHFPRLLEAPTARGWPLMVWSPDLSGIGRAIAFLGAGIYEELLFRLILLPMLFAALHATGFSKRASWMNAVAIGSLLFAAAHYRLSLDLGVVQLATNAGDSFTWLTFGFRVSAGAFFSLLFLYRGFGVAAGAHALYDILVAA